MNPNRDLQTAKPHQVNYRDWTILVFPGTDGYRPLCLASETEVLSDTKPYATPEVAIAAGKRFIDRAIGHQEVA
jgi:hypothetical protein